MLGISDAPPKIFLHQLPRRSAYSQDPPRNFARCHDSSHARLSYLSRWITSSTDLRVVGP